ncbi:MAG TPA: DUF4038 domain-containing protein [Bryobacteraceae bacterium]|nr:DUF4038 domain-containing protein [Bryobacteraceae bacterium]
MLFRSLALAATFACVTFAQTVCGPTPVYSVCELVFELDAQEMAAHPNPYLTVNLRAEIRSPRARTIAPSAFWDGGNRMVIRFSPSIEGQWDFRVTGNIARFHNKEGQLTATASEHPGFLRPANGHHWMTMGNRKPHLWMGDTRYDFAWMASEDFGKWLDIRAAQKFTHVRGYAIGRGERATWTSPDTPNVAFYKTLDDRVGQMNRKGIVVDLILGQDQDHLRKEFPSAPQRERYIRYMASRYGAYDVTWQLVQEFEEYTDGRELMKQLGTELKNADPYNHPRTTHTTSTSSPLLADGWMDHVLYQSSDDDLGAIEHQLYAVPFVNSEFGYENSGAGQTHAHHIDSATFRKRLWNATMNGQYPVFGNTGTYGSLTLTSDLKHADSPGSKAMTVWRDFFAATRYWELEPYFDVDGGRAMALPGTEYIVYIEKPAGPVEVRLEKHGYNVKWVDPATGAVTPAKDFKSERQSFEPPDASHDWILHISREERKEGMLRSWKFESRPFLMQEVESAVTKVPFEIVQPGVDEIAPGVAPRYEVKLKRETRGTRAMMYLWTGESPSNNQGFRVLGTGPQGTFKLDKALLQNAPTVMNVRVHAMNANGKVYLLDKIFRWKQ